jgi:hypothetical protein
MPHGGAGTPSDAELRDRWSRWQKANPFEVLGVPPSADGDAVRRAFLALTKQLHPNKFARASAATRDLATEVFLLVRKAYDQVASEEGRQRVRARLAPVPVPMAPAATPPAGMAAATTPSQTGLRPATAPSQTGLRPATAPSQTGLRPATVPGPVPAPPASSAAPPPRAATVPGPVPPPARGTGALPTSPPSGPPGSRQDVQALLELARTRTTRFDEALRELALGRYRAAREALQKIAAEDPASRRYRGYLCLAWGLEHMSEGRLVEARRELERAAELEKESSEIHQALTRLEEKERAAKTEKGKGKGGILGKLFGK